MLLELGQDGIRGCITQTPSLYDLDSERCLIGTPDGMPTHSFYV